MGWASASSYMNDLIKSLQKNVPDDKARRSIYRDMVRSFNGGDWDTQGDCTGMDKAFDDALRAVDRRR